jgi:hypothetical protein
LTIHCKALHMYSLLSYPYFSKEERTCGYVATRARGQCSLYYTTHLHKSPDKISHLLKKKYNYASILLTNLLNSQEMLWRPIWNAPIATRGEFEHCRACVLWIIAPAPVRHALSNSRRAGQTKRVTGALRRDMNAHATVAQI